MRARLHVPACAYMWVQENGLVPIVEPEVTLGPGNYGIEETAFWSERVYSHVMRLLNEYGVIMEGILLKPNMCLPGGWGGGQRSRCGAQARGGAQPHVNAIPARVAACTCRRAAHAYS